MIGACLLAVVLSAMPGDDVELLQFSSGHCPACRTLEPVVDRAAAAGLKVRHLDFEAHEDLARDMKIARLPTLVLVRRGAEVDRVVGAVTYDRLTDWLQELGVTMPAGPGNGQIAARLPAEQFAQPPQYPNQAALQTQLNAQPTSPPASRDRQDLFAATARALTPTSTHQDNSAIPGAGPANGSGTTADQLALAATVRLKVEEGQGMGFGTGTIVDMHGEEALVFTCGHLFRESQGKGKITIDMFLPGQPQGVAGHLIDYDLHRDVALVAFRPGIKLTPVPVASADFRPQVGEPVFTIGCNKGTTPSIVGSRLASIDKFNGRPNYTVQGQPIDGRSGGGLFAADGRLIGICNAADAVDNEGLYASLPAIHWQLDRIGQQRIYQPAGATPPVFAINNPPTTNDRPASQLATAGNIPSLPTQMPPMSMPQETAAVAPATSGASADDLEVLCVVRSKAQPHLPPQVFSLQQLPAEVQQQLSARQNNNAGARVASNPGDMIIRGQR